MHGSLGEQAKDVGRVLWGTLKAFYFERGTTTAAALAYSTFLSLIPICLLLLIVVDPLAAALTADTVPGAGEAANPESGQHFIDVMLGWVAPSARAEILSYLKDTAAGLRANKGSLGLLGFGGFLVTSVLLFLAIEDALNDVWKSPRRRNIGTRIAYFWCVATLVPIAVLFSMSALSGLPLLGNALSAEGVQTVLQWAVSLLLMGGMYLIFPVTHVSWRAAFWG
ncbi:MAG: YhjD/YihY/BrkB family envelope integrity protein, partial [Planctomycetota bacterium]